MNVFCILDRQIFGILNWELFGNSLHVFGILDWDVFGKSLKVFSILGWEVYCSKESSAARGRSSSDGGKSETGSHNAKI